MDTTVMDTRYKLGYDEQEVLRNRTVPLRGLFILIAGVALSGLLYNGYQKLAKKSVPAKDTRVQVSAQKLYDEAKNTQNIYYFSAGRKK